MQGRRNVKGRSLFPINFLQLMHSLQFNQGYRGWHIMATLQTCPHPIFQHSDAPEKQYTLSRRMQIACSCGCYLFSGFLPTTYFLYFHDAHIFQPFRFYELNFYFQKSYIKGCISIMVVPFYFCLSLIIFSSPIFWHWVFNFPCFHSRITSKTVVFL